MADDSAATPVLNVLVTEFVTYEVTIDPAAPEWDWLLRYPDSEWPELLRRSANETEGQMERALTHNATGAWREVNLTAVPRD